MTDLMSLSSFSEFKFDLYLQMVTKYGSDPEITALVDKFDWYIMPLANPDGYDYSHDGVSQRTPIYTTDEK